MLLKDTVVLCSRTLTRVCRLTGTLHRQQKFAWDVLQVLRPLSIWTAALLETMDGTHSVWVPTLRG